jgi:hypothetical protein
MEEHPMNLVPCPTCGHPHRVSEEPGDAALTCVECAEVFTVPSEPAVSSPLGKERREPTPRGKNLPEEDWGLRLIRGTLGDPAAALQGAIPGAFIGVFAGVLVGCLHGAAGSGAGAGEAVGGILVGFVAGFAVGTLTGALLGVLGPAERAEAGGKADLAPLLRGAGVGAAVALVVAHYRWALWGAGAGAVGAALWQWASRRVESALAEPPRQSPGEGAFPRDHDRGRRAGARRGGDRD